MVSRRYKVLVRLLLIAAAISLGLSPGLVQAQKKDKVTRDQVYVEKFKKIAPSVQKAAAKAAAKRGLKPGIAGKAGLGTLAVQTPDPGGVPHYFGPYGNWAFSPLPKGPVASVTLVDGGTGYSTAPTVTIDDAYLPSCTAIPAPPRRASPLPALPPLLRVASLPVSRLPTEAPGTWLPSSRLLMPRARAPSPTQTSAARSRAAFASSWTRLPSLGANPQTRTQTTDSRAVHPGCDCRTMHL